MFERKLFIKKIGRGKKAMTSARLDKSKALEREVLERRPRTGRTKSYVNQRRDLNGHANQQLLGQRTGESKTLEGVGQNKRSSFRLDQGKEGLRSPGNNWGSGEGGN